MTVASDLSVHAAAAANGGDIVARPFRPSVGYSIMFAMSSASLDNPLAAAFGKFALKEGPQVHRELLQVMMAS